jgi:hypothetical protein
MRNILAGNPEGKDYFGDGGRGVRTIITGC